MQHGYNMKHPTLLGVVALQCCVSFHESLFTYLFMSTDVRSKLAVFFFFSLKLMSLKTFGREFNEKHHISDLWEWFFWLRK